jgi:hypothetical protein
MSEMGKCCEGSSDYIVFSKLLTNRTLYDCEDEVSMASCRLCLLHQINHGVGAHCFASQ